MFDILSVARFRSCQPKKFYMLQKFFCENSNFQGKLITCISAIGNKIIGLNIIFRQKFQFGNRCVGELGDQLIVVLAPSTVKEPCVCFQETRLYRINLLCVNFVINPVSFSHTVTNRFLVEQ